MYLVLAYDIVEDKRRQRLFKRLHRFLQPVQKSVFEGELADARYPALTRLVEQQIDPETDSVRIYQLGKHAQALTQHFGCSLVVQTEEEDLVL